MKIYKRPRFFIENSSYPPCGNPVECRIVDIYAVDTRFFDQIIKPLGVKITQSRLPLGYDGGIEMPLYFLPLSG